jgi:molybdopterin-guanine dinucleotide biosynthesis protein
MVIGIIGKKYSGKTTAANFLKEYFISKGYSVQLMAFADALKTMILKAGLCTHDELYVEKTDFSRMILQKIGTDIFRDQVDPDFWVKKLRTAIENLDKQIVIIHDIRFKNEANLVIELGRNGKLIKILRNFEDSENKQFKNHRSETEVDSIVCENIIVNDNLSFFKGMVIDAAKKILENIKKGDMKNEKIVFSWIAFLCSFGLLNRFGCSI